MDQALGTTGIRRGTRKGTEMTVDTETKAVDFLVGMNAVFQRTGSRETCNPAPTDTDVDFVVFARDPRVVRCIAQAGFTNTSAPHVDTYGGSGPFETFRCGEVNLIVTYDERFYDAWCGATMIAKRLNLMNKADRIALFQGFLYCNWESWLTINHALEF